MFHIPPFPSSRRLRLTRAFFPCSFSFSFSFVPLVFFFFFPSPTWLIGRFCFSTPRATIILCQDIISVLSPPPTARPICSDSVIGPRLHHIIPSLMRPRSVPVSPASPPFSLSNAHINTFPLVSRYRFPAFLSLPFGVLYSCRMAFGALSCSSRPLAIRSLFSFAHPPPTHTVVVVVVVHLRPFPRFISHLPTCLPACLA